jgi:citrate lyase subunit beta / citryl-CoA lyase
MKPAAGSLNKADCRVTVTGGEPPSLDIKTDSVELFGEGITAIVTETLERLGAKTALCVEDKGAVDYVVAARVEAAMRQARPELAPIRPAVTPLKRSADRIRRSRLYAPGNNPRLLVGIELHGADCVLLDLEDSVPPAEKASARILVKHLLATIAFPEVWVRINPLDGEGKDDLAEVLLGRPHGVCLPKAEAPGDVTALAEALARLEETMGIEVGGTSILPILETGKGVLHAEEIASADPRVVAIAFGAEDYTRDLGGRRTRDALLFARSHVAAAAAAAGVQASDTVFADVEDEAGLVAEATEARDLGFSGKGVINPRQIGPVHRVFSPSEAEIAQAKRVVDAAEQAEARGSGAVALEGKMIDRPVLARAQRILRLAEALGKGTWR